MKKHWLPLLLAILFVSALVIPALAQHRPMGNLGPPSSQGGSFVGPAGPEGPMGSPGPAGSPGATGSPGPAGAVGLPPAALATFGTCDAGHEGIYATQNNSTGACVAGATATTAGTTHCAVYCNGTNWLQTGL